MLLPRPIRKIIKVFRGSLSPALIMLSVLLGFWFGLTPGWTGIHAALIIGLVLLNVSFGLFVMSALLGKVLGLAGAVVLYQVGDVVQTWLGGLLRALAAVPIVGFTDFSVYAVCGAVVLGPVVGLVLGLLMAKLVMAFRRTWLRLEEGSEKLRNWRRKWWVRLLDRILIGKSVKDVRGVLEGKQPVLRRGGLAMAVILALVFAVGARYLSGEAARAATARGLTRVNGAQVDIDGMNINLRALQLDLRGLAMTDPEKPEVNRLTAEELSARAGAYYLSLGRFHLRDVVLSSVRFDSPRATPGAVVRRERRDDREAAERVLEGMDAETLERYFRQAQKVREWLNNLREWLPAPSEREPVYAPENYLDYLTARTQANPVWRFLAEQVVLEHVVLGEGPLADCRITITNLTDAPASVGRPIGVRIESHSGELVVDAALSYGDAGPAAISGSVTGLDMAYLQEALRGDNLVTFSQGTAAATFAGQISPELLDVRFDVSLTDLQANARSGLLGLDAATAEQAFSLLRNLECGLRLAGSMSQPRLAIETGGLGEQLRAALVDAGRERLAQEVEKQLGERLPAEVQDTGRQVIEGLGGLLQRPGRRQDED